MKSFYFSFTGKKYITTIVICFFSAFTFSQNVGVSDLSSFNPVNLFHIYKNSSSASTLMQISNSASGSAISDGLTFDVDGSFNISLNNREATSLGFNTSGTTRMTILSGGNVGIGTTNPSAPLDVTATSTIGIRYIKTGSADARITIGDPTQNWSWATGWATGGDFSLIEEGTSGNRIYIKRTTGNVGIGTSSPSKKLDITGDINFSGALYANGSAGTSGQLLYSNAGATNGWLGVGTSGQILISTGGVPGWNTLASINGVTTSCGTTNYVPKMSGATTLSCSQIYDDGTNVGIGTTSPAAKLHIVNAYPFVAGNDGMLKIKSIAVTGAGGCCGTECVSLQTSIDNRTDDYTISGYGGDNRHVLSLQSQGGYVGVGTTGPIGKLDILAGSARTGTHATTPSFYVTGSIASGQTGPAANNIEFRHDNGTQGIGFGYNTIYQTGSNTNQELNILSRGSSPITLNAYPYSTGNVGIGTTLPLFKTHITSDVTMDGDITAGTAQLSVGGSTTVGKRMLIGYDVNGNGFGFIKAGNYGVTWTPLSLQPSGGNVGVGTTNPGAKLEVYNSAAIPALSIGDNGIDNASNYGMVNLTRPADLTRAHLAFIRTGNYVWQMGYVQNTNTFGIFPWNLTSAGTPAIAFTTSSLVGIGTISPSEKLQVVGKTTLSRDGASECCSGGSYTLALSESTSSTGNKASIQFHNGGYDEGQIQLTSGNTVIGGNSRRFKMFDNQSVTMGLEITGKLYYGNNQSRTEYRTNAGLDAGGGAQSGFFENDGATVTNYPAGASSWWHLIDCRHNNNANNYALQIAGSFFDQDLYYRKTNNNPSQSWSKILTPSNGVSQIISSSLTSNVNFGTILPSYTDLGVSVTFTATKSTALVELTASGYGYTNSMSYVGLRVFNVTTGTSVGGTIEKIQNYDDMSGTVTTWSCSFSKLISGLTAGSSYTLKVQGGVSGIMGTPNAVIDAASTPDQDHLTLNVIQ